MALYAIGDLHLSFGADKPMNVFGGNWENYMEKIAEGFSVLGDDDLCVICGDISWAMNLESSGEDFKFIDNLPGKKIILKGNHDYWWSTASKAKKFLAGLGISGIDFLHNNCFFYNDGTAICGTRGWFCMEETHGGHDRKIMMREIGRLETSLKAAGDAQKHVFLHYPPVYGDYMCDEILELFSAYKVASCHSGHIHGKGLRFVFEGALNGTCHRTVSGDYLSFKPIKILD